MTAPAHLQAALHQSDPAAASSYLKLDGLAAAYGGLVAAQDISLDIRRGELIALLGPSGCGKTTTLRMIAGFVQPTAGRVLLNDRDITKVAPHRRNIGIAFQSYALFPHLSVLENVAFGLRMRHVGRDERNARAAAALEMVGLSSYSERYPANLSGGQQQRVALARALVIEPELLLLDEPLSNLDALLRGEMRSEIRALQQRLSITTVFVTHDQSEAMAMSDRVVLMNSGRIVEVGTPRSVSDQPRNEFTASFLGERSVLPGEVRGDTFSTNGITWPNAPADARHMVLRSSRLRFNAEAGPAVVGGTVTASAFLGDVVETDVETSAGRVRLVTPSDLPVPQVGESCVIHAMPGGVTFI